jgi:diguanylate cyclase (GGDEF)-like protein/PAS domain S-box-containing protein
MQGPIVDIVLLLLLILFFGLQQRSRSQQIYRFWFGGWTAVVCSYALWELKLTSPLAISFQEALRYDLSLAGLLIFLVSFVIHERQLKRTILECLYVGIPVVLVIDAQAFVAVPRGVTMAAVVLWELCGIRAASRLVPVGRVKTRAALYTICVVFCVGMLVYLSGRGPVGDLSDWSLSEVALSTAVLYGGGMRKRTFAVYVGMAGFLMWSAFYFTGILLKHDPEPLRVFYLFWNFPKYFVGFAMILRVFEDATEEKTKLAEEFRAMYAGYPYPVWIYEAATGRVLSANTEAMRGYGYSEEEFLRMRVEDLETEPTESIEGLLAPLQEGRRTMHLHKDGRSVWVHVTDRSITFQGSDAKMLVARDITDKVKLNRELSFRAHHDVLTGLPNRMLLADRIQQCMVRCDRENRKGLLLMIDVDHFKQINDTYGHAFGDECLRLVAARLSSKIRQIDTIARVGGEEFAAIIGGLHQDSDAKIITDLLLGVFETPLKMRDCDVMVTVSIGGAIYPDDGLDGDTLMRKADDALYAAKRFGRNRAVMAATAFLPQEFAGNAGDLDGATLV